MADRRSFFFLPSISIIPVTHSRTPPSRGYRSLFQGSVVRIIHIVSKFAFLLVVAGLCLSATNFASAAPAGPATGPGDDCQRTIEFWQRRISTLSETRDRVLSLYVSTGLPAFERVVNFFDARLAQANVDAAQEIAEACN